jgi:hypothetical protein
MRRDFQSMTFCSTPLRDRWVADEFGSGLSEAGHGFNRAKEAQEMERLQPLRDKTPVVIG